MPQVRAAVDSCCPPIVFCRAYVVHELGTELVELRQLIFVFMGTMDCCKGIAAKAV
jgi:hypothetical protein